MSDVALHTLSCAIAGQRDYVRQWSRPVEALLYETVRAIDLVFCRELFLSDERASDTAKTKWSLMGWGTNRALATMIGDTLHHGPFRLFPSTELTQQPADELLFHCGILQRAELLHGWLAEGLVSASLRPGPKPARSGCKEILILKSKHPSLFHEAIPRMHREWMSLELMKNDREWEKILETEHMELLPELVTRIREFQGWGLSYATTDEIDRHFLEWGQVYLRRMWSQDLVGLDEKIGGNQFNEYLGILAALAGRAQKHLCFAAMLNRRNPKLDLRNLLTSFAHCEEFHVQLARQLDADSLHVQRLLSHLTLDCDNRDAHTQSGDMTWAPIVRCSHDHYILPLYGLEINPFLFLLRDLRTKYPSDWSMAANNRERRWQADLRSIFRSERWIHSGENVELRDAGRAVTDIDFLAYDIENNELAVMQLKWQQPVGVDNKARRSAAKNLVEEGNKWTVAVLRWLETHGHQRLLERMGTIGRPGLRAELFVICRYGAHFSGLEGQDSRATWVDWNHFLRVRVEDPRASVSQVAKMLRTEVESIASSMKGESYAFPIGDLAVILNPVQEPDPAK